MSEEEDARKNVANYTYKSNKYARKIETLHQTTISLTIESSPQQLSEFSLRCDALKSNYEELELYEYELVKCYNLLDEPEKLIELK